MSNYIDMHAAQEIDRLAALRSLHLFGTPPEERFDRITRIACEIFGVPAAFITLIDEHNWTIKSPRMPPGLAELPREDALCDHTIRSSEMLVVPDATKDERFASLDLVTSSQIRFYAGQSLSLGNDLRLGALCLIDPEPRQLGGADRELLKEMAQWVEREMQEGLQRDWAVDVQRSLFPLDMVGRDDFELVGVCIPAHGVSGDYYAWNETPAGLDFTLADVMGKGAGAAILASALRMAFKVYPGLEVAETIRLVSDGVANDLEAAGAFATLVHGRYQPLTGRVDYADAGHGLTIVVRMDGTVERLQSTGLPIGIAPHLGWDSASAMLAEGDMLLSVSDGVLDLFDGTIDSLNALALFVTPDSSAQDIADRVKVAAKAGPGGGDDVTVIVLRRLR